MRPQRGPLRALACVAIVAVACVGWSLAAAAPVAAADPATFGTPAATSKFGDGIHFTQPVSISAPIQEVDILYESPGDEGPTVEPVADAHPSGAATLDYHLDLSGGRAVPNTPFAAWWRLTAADGTTVDGPKIHETYADRDHLTGDVGGRSSTAEFTDAVIRRLQ